LKNKPTLTLRGVFGAGIVVTLLYLVLESNFRLGGWLTLLITGLWFVWGRIRFRDHIWIHPSFSLMVFSICVSFVLALREITPVWLNLGGFSIVAICLVTWANRPLKLLEKKDE